MVGSYLYPLDLDIKIECKEEPNYDQKNCQEREKDVKVSHILHSNDITSKTIFVSGNLAYPNIFLVALEVLKFFSHMH